MAFVRSVHRSQIIIINRKHESDEEFRNIMQDKCCMSENGWYHRIRKLHSFLPRSRSTSCLDLNPEPLSSLRPFPPVPSPIAKGALPACSIRKTSLITFIGLRLPQTFALISLMPAALSTG